MNLVRLHNTTKRYGDNRVLREVYLRLSQAERVGLIAKADKMGVSRWT
jgi:ATPase subunit of ABC transporter with duplicated ATPase domains